MSAFDLAIQELLRQEGGYVHHAADPGGETKYGISQRAYPTIDIANLTVEAAKDIYHRDYWTAVRGDDLPWVLAVVMFDAGVNCGVKRAIRWLQQAVHVTDDGVIGSQTIAATRMAEPVQAAAGFQRRRVKYHASLPTWDTFGDGWTQRCFEVFAFALSSHPAP